MANDLIPRSFWSFPTLRFSNLWDEDDDWLPQTTVPSGLSVSEDENKVYVEAAVPGLDPKDIEITFHKGVLWIKGEKKQKEEDKKKKFYRESSSSFSYRVVVPGNLDQKKEPDAKCENGVMTIAFDKVPEEQPKKITVKK